MNQYIINGLVVLALVIGSFTLGWHERVLREPALIAAQKTSDNNQCDADKKTTKEANDEIIKNLSDINAKRNAAKRMHATVCVTPAPSTAQLPTGGDGKYAGQNGAVVGTSDDFRDFGAECEIYRSEMTICINSLN